MVAAVPPVRSVPRSPFPAKRESERATTAYSGDGTNTTKCGSGGVGSASDQTNG